MSIATSKHYTEPAKSEKQTTVKGRKAAKLNRHQDIDVNRVSAAFSYARRGWPVLPLHGIAKGVCTCSAGASCKSPGKHPILDGGVHSATTSLGEIKRMWHQHPHANVGIATGSKSGLVAIDVDPRNGGRDTSKALAQELGPLPRTVYSETGGGGYHRLFKHPAEPISTRHPLPGLPGMDLQSDGAFIVVPPSLHVSGRRYQWRKGRDPGSLGIVDFARRLLGSLSRVADDHFEADCRTAG